MAGPILHAGHEYQIANGADLQRERQCVLNLPSADLVAAVNRLALTTGRNPVPGYKTEMGYRYEPDKFGIAQLTPVPADLVKPPRVAECPVQLEAMIETIHPFGAPDDHVAAIEARIIRVHVEESILVAGKRNYIDPEQWNPLIMNFCEFFGLSPKLHPSRLAKVYRPSDETEELALAR